MTDTSGKKPNYYYDTIFLLLWKGNLSLEAQIFPCSFTGTTREWQWTFSYSSPWYITPRTLFPFFGVRLKVFFSHFTLFARFFNIYLLSIFVGESSDDSICQDSVISKIAHLIVVQWFCFLFECFRVVNRVSILSAETKSIENLYKNQLCQKWSYIVK